MMKKKDNASAIISAIIVFCTALVLLLFYYIFARKVPELTEGYDHLNVENILSNGDLVVLFTAILCRNFSLILSVASIGFFIYLIINNLSNIFKNFGKFLLTIIVAAGITGCIWTLTKATKLDAIYDYVFRGVIFSTFTAKVAFIYAGIIGALCAVLICIYNFVGGSFTRFLVFAFAFAAVVLLLIDIQRYIESCQSGAIAYTVSDFDRDIFSISSWRQIVWVVLSQIKYAVLPEISALAYIMLASIGEHIHARGKKVNLLIRLFFAALMLIPLVCSFKFTSAALFDTTLMAGSIDMYVMAGANLLLINIGLPFGIAAASKHSGYPVGYLILFFMPLLALLGYVGVVIGIIISIIAAFTLFGGIFSGGGDGDDVFIIIFRG